jgi:hypothetical protein
MTFGVLNVTLLLILRYHCDERKPQPAEVNTKVVAGRTSLTSKQMQRPQGLFRLDVTSVPCEWPVCDSPSPIAPIGGRQSLPLDTAADAPSAIAAHNQEARPLEPPRRRSETTNHNPHRGQTY